MGERTAHAVSTVTLVGALTAYTAALQRRWPLGSSLVALRIGMVWAVATIGFEAALGRASGGSWRDLLGAYDLRRGELWALVPAAMAVLPEVQRRLTR